MANIKSQMKRIRTNEKACPCNQSVKSELKAFMRKTREAVVAGDKTAAESVLRVAICKLDVATSKGIIRENQAAQRKSEPTISVAAMN